MSELTETLLCLAFMFFGLRYFDQAHEGIMRRFDRDGDKQDRREDARHARHIETAREFGFKNSPLHKELNEPPEVTKTKK